MSKLRVNAIRYEAEGIYAFDLVDPEGAPLPAVEAGAHLDIRTPGNVSRRYSLCNEPGSTDFYRIAVLNVPDSRGGSRAMHEQVRPGDMLEVTGMHNYFPLQENAGHSTLLAGGIGITPLLAMAQRLNALGRPYTLHYCTQSAERTAFAALLAQDQWRERIFVHHDGGDPAKGLDIVQLLQRRPEDGHLYFCGPPGFMRAVQAACTHWPDGTVHSEHFGADLQAPAAPAAGAAPASVKLSRSDRLVPVEPGQTILQALREAGVVCNSSCEAGLCGECRLHHLSGEIEHNDYLLSDQERADSVLICCARVREGMVVLDI